MVRTTSKTQYHPTELVYTNCRFLWFTPYSLHAIRTTQLVCNVNYNTNNTDVATIITTTYTLEKVSNSYSINYCLFF